MRRGLLHVVSTVVFAGVVGCPLFPEPSVFLNLESPLPEYPECRSQCELQAAECPEMPIEDFRSFDDELAEWTRVAGEMGCVWDYQIAGECEGGTMLLYARFSEGSIVQFYDGGTAEFLGLETLTDMRQPPCYGTGFWPRRVACAQPRVTSIVCARTPFTPAVGESIRIDSRD